jgi:hypothetical protein
LRISIMTTPHRIKLQQAVAEAARNLQSAMARASERTGPPAPGDLFVFDTGEEAALEWLVVREHPDDPTLLLLAPGDDFPLSGPPDVALSRELVGQTLTIRCGESLWVPLHFCQQRLRTGSVPVGALRLVRRKISELARGRAEETEEQRQTEVDPEYQGWLALVARAREHFQQRADQTPIDLGLVIPFEQLSARLPAELAGDPQYALAAESGSPLVSALSDAFAASAAATRYHEIDIDRSGKLILQTIECGVRAVWTGPIGVGAPKLIGRTVSGEAIEPAWQVGPQGKLQRADPILPWVDGQIVITIATEPPKTVTIQR